MHCLTADVIFDFIGMSDRVSLGRAAFGPRSPDVVTAAADFQHATLHRDGPGRAVLVNSAVFYGDSLAKGASRFTISRSMRSRRFSSRRRRSSAWTERAETIARDCCWGALLEMSLSAVQGPSMPDLRKTLASL